MINQQFQFISRLKFNAKATLLKEAKKLVFIDTQNSIPFLVWLCENPKSPIALPGKITLNSHDCLHAILGLGTSLADEAFLIGLTMGNDSNIKAWHLKLFKFVSEFLYPPKFRFRSQDFYLFNLGVEYGKKLKIKNLNKIDFAQYEEQTIAELRDWLDIHDILLLLNEDLNLPQLEMHSTQLSVVG